MWAGDVAQLVDYLSSTQKPWVPLPAWPKPGMVVHLSNKRTSDVEAGESEVQGCLWLLRKLVPSLGSVRHCKLPWGWAYLLGTTAMPRQKGHKAGG